VYTPITPSTLRLQDGRELHWKGFFTGHRVLSDDEVAGYAYRLLHATPSTVTVLAAQELSCYRASDGSTPPSLLLHSATGTIKCFEGDVEDLALGRSPRDVGTFCEARSVYLGTSTDLTVGRTEPWSDAARLRGVPAVNIGKQEYYYLSHALLEAAGEHASGTITPLTEVVAWLREHPGAVIRPYVLDVETQIFLLWLRREAGLPRLWIDANKPAVDARWNRKSHIHPIVARARELDVKGLPVDELLIEEQHESEAFVQLRLEVPVLPGYTIPRAGISQTQFVAEVLEAASLLRRRYGISTGALKPSQAGEGARIVGNIDLDADDSLTILASEAYVHGDDYLLEAWTEFLLFTADEARHPVVPSGHFRYGQVAEGLTLQSLNRYCWNGNVFVDEAAWDKLGLPMSIYWTIRNAMESIRRAFVSSHSPEDGCYEGLVIGGIDFAVGRVGGHFGDRTLVGAIDFNLSSHGAEYMRAFREEARTVGSFEQYVATRVFRPTVSATLEGLETIVRLEVGSSGLAKIIACVPDRWGMVATTGGDLPEAMKRVQDMVNVLADRGLAAS